MIKIMMIKIIMLLNRMVIIILIKMVKMINKMINKIRIKANNKADSNTNDDDIIII